MAIAFFCGVMGAWMVMPFSLLEIAGLGWAFHYLDCHAQDYEKLTIDGDRVILERRDYRDLMTVELNRAWAHPALHCARPRRGCRLALRVHGKDFEFGRFLNDEQRISLAEQLQTKLGTPKY